jgi:transposase
VRRNKTDVGDARGIAQAGRLAGKLIARVHLKSLECQLLQSRLSIRRHLIRQRMRTVNLLCRQIEHYGGRVAGTTEKRYLRAKAEPEIRRLFGRTASTLGPELHLLLENAERLQEYERLLDLELNRFARASEICRRWMEIPGVGPICALSFYSTVGDPHRFSRSADIGPYFGLTPRIHQSGLMERFGRISKMGNKETRSALVRSSMSFMRWSRGVSPLGCWAQEVENRVGRRKARVAVARKLAIVMLAMWKSGERYRAAMPRT